jgi:hypothetical protein
MMSHISMEVIQQQPKPMDVFVGTKIVHARPMSLGEYNEYRGWDIPANEDPTTEGYFIEMPGTVPNDSTHAGYITWSRKDAFDESHVLISHANDGIAPTNRAPTNQIMQFFTYAHLPAHLQGVSKLVGLLAQQMDSLLPDGAEKSSGMRKLLEAKDCFVRSLLTKQK